MIKPTVKSTVANLRNSVLEVHEAISDYCLAMVGYDLENVSMETFRKIVQPVIQAFGDSLMWSSNRLDEIVDMADQDSQSEAIAARLRDFLLDYQEPVLEFINKLPDAGWGPSSVEDCRWYICAMLEQYAQTLMYLSQALDDLIDLFPSEQPAE